VNQCDGCRAGWELRNGLHYDRHDKVQMACTAKQYQPLALLLADELENPSYGWIVTPKQCAAELRLLHTSNEQLREQNSELDAQLAEADALLLRCFKVLIGPTYHQSTQWLELTDELSQRLGVTE
jgi:hypothetical protein